MSNVPLVRRAIAGAALANTSTNDALSLNPEGNSWTPAALERAGSTLKALNRMAKRPPVNIMFEDIGYSVTTSNGERRILHNVSGEFRSGELACILGPSGAGKSTLLNILAGYKSTGFNGRITVNDQARDMRVFKKLSSYIMQDDMLQPRLTVNESMMIAADLKLGSELGKAEKILVVEEILQTLGLWNQRNTMSQDLSGGQSKRLSVALELVNNPPVIILDEPTTGLDIVSIRQLVVLLRLLSRQGRTIICTIHQPSASLFSLFDQVYVLAQGLCCYQVSSNEHTHENTPEKKIFKDWYERNHIIPLKDMSADCAPAMAGRYKGFIPKNKLQSFLMRMTSFIVNLSLPEIRLNFSDFAIRSSKQSKNPGAAPLLVPYLSEIGQVCPKTHNPADFVLETLVGYTEIAAQMSELCQNGKQCRKLDRMTAREGRKPVLHSDETMQRIFTEHVAKEQLQKMEFATTFITQFLILIKRMFLQMRRNSTSLWIQLMHHMSAAMLLGGIFFLIGNDGSAPIANFKFCLSCVVFFMYTYIMIPILLFPIELRMLRREYFNRWYSLKAYYVALTLSTIPLMIILGTLFIVICYTMSGQLLEFDRFLLFTITGLMTGICSEGLGLLVGSTFSSTNGSIIGPATVAPLLALCCYGIGFGPSIENIMKLLMSMSYLRYALSGFCLALYQKRPAMDCNEDFCLYADTKILLRDVGMSNDTYSTQIIGLLLFTILHRTVAYFTLRYRLTQEFTNKFMTYISKFLKHR